MTDFWEGYAGNFIYSQSFCQESSKEAAEEIFRLVGDVWGGDWTLVSRPIKQNIQS